MSSEAITTQPVSQSQSLSRVRDARREIWAAYIAEGLGTFGLVFAGCGAIMIDTISHGQITHVGVGLVFGLDHHCNDLYLRTYQRSTLQSSGHTRFCAGTSLPGKAALWVLDRSIRGISACGWHAYGSYWEMRRISARRYPPGVVEHGNPSL